MPDGGVTELIVAAADFIGGTDLAIDAAVFISEYGTYIEIAAVVASAYSVREQQARAQRAAKDAYNASLRDRYVMSRGATQPRQIVLGRARVSGPMFFVQSYGPNREHLVFCVALAAHEIDAVEQVFFDDLPVVMDGSGNVLGVVQKETFSTTSSTAVYTLNTLPQAATVTAQAVYGTTIVALGVSVSGSTVTVTGATAGVVGIVEIRYQPSPSPFTNGTITSTSQVFATTSTTQTFVLSQSPLSSSVHAAQNPAFHSYVAPTVVSVSGLNVTLSGLSVGSNVTISYQVGASASKARIRTYAGAPGQTADAGMVADFPGIWTSACTASAIAYLVVELDYDPTAFPGGIPNVSATVRGAKCYDPRTGATAWSDNPALMLRYFALSPLGGRMTASLINDTSIIAAANICDTVTNYVVNGQTYTRPLYRAGLVSNTGARPQDVIGDLCQAMAGKWCFVDGMLRVKAGSFTTPVMALDESWLHEGQKVNVKPHRARADLVNLVTGTFADESLSYQVTQMPRVAPSAYITEDGTELPLDLTLNAVQFVGQAQQVAGVMLRDARQGLQLTVLCNMRAYPLEMFDVITVNLSRFGFVNQTFEVLDISWTLDGGIQLTLKATDATITAVSNSFPAFDPSKATRLPSPWIVAPIVSLAASSGTAQLLVQADGTIVSRISVTWAALSDQAVLANGKNGVEVRYGLATTDPSTWASVQVPGTDTQAFLTPVNDGALYLIMARARNALAEGAWSLPILHQVVGKNAPPQDVSGLAATAVQTGVRIDWTAETEADYAYTELRLGGSDWASATPGLFKGTANTYTWLRPAAGSYVVRAKHYDTSGNVSTNTASIGFTLTVSDIDTALAASSAAAAAASSAQSDATAALNQLANIASDNLLSQVEKPPVILDYSNITGEQSGIDSQATALGITTEQTAYNSAVTALTSYLGGLTSPTAWNNLSGDTTIVGTTFRSNFAAVYSARQTLLNQIAAVAATTATWGSVSGVAVTTTQMVANAATDVYRAFSAGPDVVSSTS